MSHKFSLNVIRVECLNEQVREWGKDEMRLFGFAISRKGHLFATGYRSLGSYGEGDVRDDGIFPMELIDTELEDDGLEVLFYVWLVEEDGAGVRDSAAGLVQDFKTRVRDQIDFLGKLGFPRDCIPFTAFYKAALLFHSVITEAGTSGRDDEVYTPFEIILDKPTSGVALGGVSKDFSLRRVKRLGDYFVTFRFRYEAIPEILG